MSNKRIDLNKYFNMPIGGIFGVTFDQLFKDVIRHEGGGVTTQSLNLSLTQMEAIKDLPNLIAELKRCYDLIDCLEDEMKFVLQQLHRPIMGGLEWYEVRNNILNQLITNANSSTIQVLEALEQSASE